MLEARAAPIRGSTTVLELLTRFPGGEAARLMAELHWECAHCAVSAKEPLALAAKRHGNDPRRVVELFRALRDGRVDDTLLASAKDRRGLKHTTWADYATPRRS